MVTRHRSGWLSFWEEIQESPDIFRAEAKDYVGRLEPHLPNIQAAGVLDFGCGFGWVAEQLAAKVQRVYIWDQASNMRRWASGNVAGRNNVEFFDPSDFTASPSGLKFDAILVNSVVQYMTEEEFDSWLPVWAALLEDKGALIVSDLIPGDLGFLSEMISLLRFAGREGFLFRSLAERLPRFKKYWKTRSTRPLTRYDREDLRRKADQVGFRVEFLDENLTFRHGRYTAIFSVEK